MWGFHDCLLTLRKALHAFLSSSPRREALWRRWRRQQSLLNAQAGLVYTEVEWRQEWNAIVNMASTEPRLRRLSVARYLVYYLLRSNAVTEKKSCILKRYNFFSE